MPSALETTLDDARPFLLNLVEEAGAIVMRYFRRPVETLHKVGADIVTTADHESERHVADAIRSRFPDHAIYAEEGSVGADDSPFRWAIDPLDGTVNYASGVPLFAVAISLMHEGEPVLGAILDPTRSDLYFAERGRGATCNGQPLHVSATADLFNSLVYVSAFGFRRPNLVAPLSRTMERLGPRTRNLVNLGSAGISWAYVAAGYLDLELSFAVDPYTGPAGILLVREAGGRATDLQGNEWRPGMGQVVTSNGRVHDEALELLRD